MIGTPTPRPSTSLDRRPWLTRLGALAAAVVLVATCASPSPTPSQSVTSDGRTPGTAAAPGTTAAPGATPEPEWEAVTPTLADAVATLEPTRTVPAGIPLNSAFRLASLTGEDAVALAAGLSAEPAVELQVARADDGAAIVTPVLPLRASTLYRFTLTGEDGTVRGSWPVQTIRDLRIAHTIPAEESDFVPVTTGIEITFNVDGVRLADAEPYITFDPPISGHFEQSGRSIAYVPDEPLTPASRYHLRVGRGLPLAGTDRVLEDEFDLWFSTTGFTEPELRVWFQRTLVEAGTADTAVFPVSVNRRYDENDEPIGKVPARLDITVHRLPGMTEAIAGWRSVGAYWWDMSSVLGAIETAGLPLVVDASVRLRDFGPTQQDDDSRWFRLPAALPAGWYVATVALPGSTSQAVLQVTDVAVYALTTTTRSVVWANDLATGDPLDGATVHLGDRALGATDARGLLETRIGTATDETPLQELPVLIVRDGDRAAFTVAGDPECGKCGGGEGNPWWRLLQLDRSRYRTTDTVAGWGVVRARNDGSVPTTVTVSLTAWDDASGADIAISKTTITPDARGAFLVQLPLDDVPPGDYTAEVEVGGDTIASASFSVGEILKPAWSVEVAPARHAVLAGAKVGVDVHAAFFEGTPVAGTTLKVGQRRPLVRVTTDLEGNASASVTISPRRSESEGMPWWITSVGATPLDAEEAQISGAAEIAVFRAKVLPVVEAVATASRLKVTGRVHDVAFGRFENPPAGGLWAVDPYGAPRKGARVDVRVRQHFYTSTRIGSTYDFISKQTIPLYQTRERIVDLGTRTLRTNAQGRFGLRLPVSGPSNGYEVIVTAYDAKGRTAKVETWGDAPATVDVPEIGASLEGPGTWDFPVELSIGERARVDFTGGAGTTRDSRYLWTIAQSGLRDVVLTTRPNISLSFKKAWVPAAHVNAVRFTGDGYEVPNNNVALLFDTGDRQLSVAMSADKARYRPGDSATVDIRVRDPQGNPVSASVYVRAIDEKLFAIGAAGMEDPLAQLYVDDGSGVIGIGWTHHDPRPVSDGGGGDTTGGGGERSDFRDWLVNTIVSTDARGHASVTFPVSDDLTSWRIIGEAVSDDLSLGSGIVSIPVSIPFFAEATIAPSYLVTDRPIVAARGFGGGMAAGSTVSFTFSSDTLGLAATTVTAKAFRPAEIRLPALAPGTHTLRIEAVTGTGSSAQRDVLVRTFEVVGPRAVQARTTSSELTARTPVTAGEGFTTLILSDAGRGRVIPTLQELADGTPTRGDSALAAGVARRVLADTFGIDDGGTAPDVSGFMRSGGYSVVPWGGGELQLTALATMTGDPRVRGVAYWFEEAETGTRESDLYALAGRAAAGEPVLDEIRAFLDATDLTVAEQVALGLALVAAGDEAGARTIEQGLVRDHAQRYGPWVRITGGGSVGDSLMTSRAAIVAAWLGDPLAAGMDAFVADNPPKDTLLDLERALAAAAWAARMPASKASATLTVDGSARTLDIVGGQAATVVLTPAQAAAAVLEPASGSVVVTTRTAVPLGTDTLEPVDGLTVQRTISPSDGLDATDRVRVTLRVTVPSPTAEGCWMVTETVPSGLRPVVSIGDEYDEDEGGSAEAEPWSVAGQQLRWCVTRDEAGGQPPTITYLARVLTAGTYTWEPAVVQSALAPDHGTILPATTVTIRGLTGD